MRSAARYARGVVIGVAVVILALAVFNTRVNPWRVTPTPWQSESLEPYRGQAQRLRTRKAGLLRSADWGVALVGSSRTANSLDPALPQWGRPDVINLGVSAGYLHESPVIASYFIDHEPAELVLFGIDPGDLSSDTDTRPMFDFYASPFSPDASLDNEIGYLFGYTTLKASLDLLKDEKKGRVGLYGPQGMRREDISAKAGQLAFIRKTLVAKIDNGTADAADPQHPLNAEKLGKLREFLIHAREKRCPVILFYHANHALLHAEARHIGSEVTPFEKERRALVGLVAEINGPYAGSEFPPVVFWDFCDYHPLDCTPLPLDDPETGRIPNWNDLGHYTPEAGTAMLARMMGWDPPRPEWADVGRKVTPDNLEAWFAELRAGYQRYLTGEGARDLEWKEAIKTAAGR